MEGTNWQPYIQYQRKYTTADHEKAVECASKELRMHTGCTHHRTVEIHVHLGRRRRTSSNLANK